MTTAINNNLPILNNEGGLSAYLEQIKKFPMLDAENAECNKAIKRSKREN